jgi:hypothetical protein
MINAVREWLLHAGQDNNQERTMQQLSTTGPAQIYLQCWTIRELPNGERRFCGYADFEGKVSSPIETFDSVTRTGTTASGRRYVMSGRCGLDRDAEYVWRRLMRAWQIDTWRDITLELVPDARQGLVRNTSTGE